MEFIADRLRENFEFQIQNFLNFYELEQKPIEFQRSKTVVEHLNYLGILNYPKSSPTPGLDTFQVSKIIRNFLTFVFVAAVKKIFEEKGQNYTSDFNQIMRFLFKNRTDLIAETDLVSIRCSTVLVFQ